MSTETTTEIGLEHWVMELPEEEAGCEYIAEPCTRAAEWRGLKECGHHRLACDGHRVAWTRPSHIWECGTCRTWSERGFISWHRV